MCDTLSNRFEFCKELKQGLFRTGKEVKFKGPGAKYSKKLVSKLRIGWGK